MLNVKNGLFILGFVLGSAFASAVCMIVLIRRRSVRRRYDQQERMKIWDDFAGIVSILEHELKNPLQVLANLLFTLAHKYQTNEDIQGRVKRMEQERKRIHTAIETVNYLRGTPEFYEWRMEKTSIGDLVRRSINAVKDEFPSAQVLFKVEGDEPLFVKAYPPALQQAFVNILKNAVEAIWETGRQAGLVSIRVLAPARHGKCLTVAISDNGGGFAESALLKLGHLFSTKRARKPNAGMGLFVSRRILDFHHGSLEIESGPDGTTCSVLLPSWMPGDC